MKKATPCLHRHKWDNNIKTNLKEQVGRMWMKSNWERIWIVLSTCEHGNELSGFIKKKLCAINLIS
jgi:hypothetical protein